MNTAIRQYFEAIEAYLIQCPVVAAYQIIRQEVGPTDGKIRIKINLLDDSLVECFEYVCEADSGTQGLKYSFHWQDADGNLIKRWDNAPHFPNLPNSPHHIHHSDGSVSQADNIPAMLTSLETIEKKVRQ